MTTTPLSELLLVLLAALALGCGRTSEAAPLSEPRPAPTSADAIPAGPVAGKIAGRPFALKAARYSMDTRPGHEQVDVVVTEGATGDPCGDLGPAHATSVWLRWRGVGLPPAGTTRISPGEPGPWQVHYERWADGRWVGNGHASALIALRAPRVDRQLEGDVSACFGDGADSCVAGSFVARDCPIRIDAPVRGASALEPMPSASAGGWGQSPTGADFPSPAGSAQP